MVEAKFLIVLQNGTEVPLDSSPDENEKVKGKPERENNRIYDGKQPSLVKQQSLEDMWNAYENYDTGK